MSKRAELRNLGYEPTSNKLFNDNIRPYLRNDKKDNFNYKELERLIDDFIKFNKKVRMGDIAGSTEITEKLPKSWHDKLFRYSDTPLRDMGLVTNVRFERPLTTKTGIHDARPKSLNKKVFCKYLYNNFPRHKANTKSVDITKKPQAKLPNYKYTSNFKISKPVSPTEIDKSQTTEIKIIPEKTTKDYKGKALDMYLGQDNVFDINEIMYKDSNGPDYLGDHQNYPSSKIVLKNPDCSNERTSEWATKNDFQSNSNNYVVESENRGLPTESNWKHTVNYDLLNKDFNNEESPISFEKTWWPMPETQRTRGAEMINRLLDKITSYEKKFTPKYYIHNNRHYSTKGMVFEPSQVVHDYVDYLKHARPSTNYKTSILKQFKKRPLNLHYEIFDEDSLENVDNSIQKNINENCQNSNQKNTFAKEHNNSIPKNKFENQDNSTQKNTVAYQDNSYQNNTENYIITITPHDSRTKYTTANNKYSIKDHTFNDEKSTLPSNKYSTTVPLISVTENAYDNKERKDIIELKNDILKKNFKPTTDSTINYNPISNNQNTSKINTGYATTDINKNQGSLPSTVDNTYNFNNKDYLDTKMKPECKLPKSCKKNPRFWKKVKDFFRNKNVCKCKCVANKTMCKVCAASDRVIRQLLFEFQNLGNYMNAHCLEIQTFFYLNPSGGDKLRKAVREIDKSLNDYYKRSRGKCKSGQTCETFVNFSEKSDRDMILSRIADRVAVGSTIAPPYLHSVHHRQAEKY